MQFTKEHAGKWIATKGDKVVAMGENFPGLWKQVNARKDSTKIRFNLVPKGIITGFFV